jgi:hypothetical protein
MRFALACAFAFTLAASNASAKGDRLDQEVAGLLVRLRSPERVERAYGAIGVRHLAARQSGGFRLLNRNQLAPWQATLAPVVPVLIDLLRDDMPLQWVDDKDQPTVETVTTTRREAAQALVALERAAVEPLIAVADDRVLGPRADQALRQLFGGGPAGKDRAAWNAWWSTQRQQPLTNERGQWPLAAGLLLLVVSAIAFFLWRQRARLRADERRGPIFGGPKA